MAGKLGSEGSVARSSPILSPIWRSRCIGFLIWHLNAQRTCHKRLEVEPGHLPGSGLEASIPSLLSYLSHTVTERACVQERGRGPPFPRQEVQRISGPSELAVLSLTHPTEGLLCLSEFLFTMRQLEVTALFTSLLDDRTGSEAASPLCSPLPGFLGAPW